MVRLGCGDAVHPKPDELDLQPIEIRQLVRLLEVGRDRLRIIARRPVVKFSGAMVCSPESSTTGCRRHPSAQLTAAIARRPGRRLGNLGPDIGRRSLVPSRIAFKCRRSRRSFPFGSVDSRRSAVSLAEYRVGRSVEPHDGDQFLRADGAVHPSVTEGSGLVPGCSTWRPDRQRDRRAGREAAGTARRRRRLSRVASPARRCCGRPAAATGQRRAREHHRRADSRRL